MKKSMRRVFAGVRLTAIVLLVTILSAPLAACQKAPSQAITDEVRQEQTDTEMPTASSKPKRVDMPTHASAEPTQIASLELTMDADVEVPAEAQFALMEVSPQDFTVQDAAAIGAAAAGQEALSLYSSYDPGREYWERKLTEAVESGQADSIYIEYLEQMRDEASDQTEKVDFDETSALRANVQTDLYFENGAEIGRLTFFPEGNQMGFDRDISENFLPESILDTGSGQVIREEPAIGEEAARKIAERFRDEYAPQLTEAAAERCLITNSGGRSSATGWYFVFTRNVAGLQKSYSAESYYINPESAPTLAAPWEPEMLTITVDDLGIVAIMWTGASTPAGSDLQEVALAPFSDIQDAATEQLGYMFGPSETSGGRGMKLRVTDFALGTEMLAAANDPDKGMYSPVWAVSYDYSYGDGDDWSHGRIFLDGQNGRYVEPRVTTTYLMEYD